MSCTVNTRLFSNINISQLVLSYIASSYNQLIGITRVYPDDMKSDDVVPIAPEFVNLKLSDLKIIATLGVGGFGRVELVRLLHLC